MTNRKIQNDHLAEVIEAFRQRASEPVSSPGIGAPEPAPHTVADAFATSAPTVDHRAAVTATQSLRQAIAEFVKPKISNPSLLHGTRTTLILEQLVNDILPMLEGSEELRTLASTVLEDEMGRRQELASRIHTGLAA
jgi:hypothetical protein